MTKLILPITKPCDYEVAVPGSKSIALRQMVISALARSQTTLKGIPPCDDIDAMLSCLETLGTDFRKGSKNEITVDPGMNLIDNVVLNARQSGVSLRLLLALAALRSGKTTFEGHDSLAKRPNVPLVNALLELGCQVETSKGYLPITVSGPVHTNTTNLDAGLSSQYLTALLLLGPCLKGGLTVKLDGEVASKTYIEVTLNELAKRNIHWQKSNNALHVEEHHHEGGEVQIEGDASASTYHMALATLHGGTVRITNLGSDTLQGDFEFKSVCEKLGAKIVCNRDSTVLRGPEQLETVNEIDFADMPDAAPTFMAMAPFLNEPVTLTGLATLPHKECNRIECPAMELRKAGVRVETGSDWMTVWPENPQATEFETYNDHRMAMSFSVFATKVAGCRIQDPRCVNKTYTEFWKDLALAYD